MTVAGATVNTYGRLIVRAPSEIEFGDTRRFRRAPAPAPAD